MDVVELREFYTTPFGRVTGRTLAAAMRPLLRATKDQVVLGLGFAPPYLEALVPPDAISLAFMPARQGVIHWPRQAAPRAALVDEHDLPLLESTADHVLVVHGLEAAENPLEMLHEIWRVMAPQGRLVLVVPNRRGLWSAADTSPFGHGQPFSRSQLARLLKEARFSVVNWKHALFMPPLNRKIIRRAAGMAESVGRYTFNRFSGVIIVEAMKQVYAFSSGKRARRFVPQLRPALLPSPQPTPRQDNR